MIALARPKRSKTADPSPSIMPPASSGGGAASHAIARLVPLDPGLYAFSLTGNTGRHEPLAGLALPAVHLCAPPRQTGTVEITDSFGRAGSWLGGRQKVLFVTSPTGGVVLVTGYLARYSDSGPLALDIRRLAASGPAKIAAEGGEQEVAPRTPSLARVVTLTGSQSVPEERARPISLDVVAHIRGRGDVHFRNTPWVGRLGRGLWIEGFAIFPDRGSASAIIEYKGLSADGTETPWIGSGTFCGTQGRGIPLIGFAVRQKTVSGGPSVDCEYTGYFQSGATAGPARNGAPCRSAHDQDALEGMQLRITRRNRRLLSGEDGAAP